MPRESVAWSLTTVAVSKLRVGNPVGKGAFVAVGVSVGVAKRVGVREPFGVPGIAELVGVSVMVAGAGVQVIKLTLSAPL